MSDVVRLTDEKGRWHAREVSYVEGSWKQVLERLPFFETGEYWVAPDMPANPYLRSVIRLPLTRMEYPIPVGVVSNTYTLAQHRAVAQKCVEGIQAAGVEVAGLRCEVGLTELGEWMNLRIYFPESYNYAAADHQKLGLRLECFNSVDGSSRLILLLGWLRFVCTNGLVIGETRAELRDVHDRYMDLEKIPTIIRKALERVAGERKRLSSWEGTQVGEKQLKWFVDDPLSASWGKKAACRTFHICRSGFDVELQSPFKAGPASAKLVRQVQRVPGAPDVARTLYDVGQALSWIATARQDSEERLTWQAQIPGLLEQLGAVRV